MATDIIARGMAGRANKRIDELSAGGAPYIQDGNWYTWDEATGTYVDTGIKAEGTDGTDGIDATINGFTAVEIVAGDNITVDAIDSTLTISAQVPTELSELTDDVGYVLESEYDTKISEIDASISDLNLNKADKSDTYTKAEVDAKVSSVYKYKGVVENIDKLNEIVDPEVGDVYDVLETGDNYAWNGTEWDKLSGIIDLSNYALKSELPTATSDLVNDSDFVSDADYVHTDNNFTDEEKEKLEGLENYNDTEIRNLINEKQDILIAGDNITIDPDTNVISSNALLEIPQATETDLGGIKAKPRTDEEMEVVIDELTGKLYVDAIKGDIKSYSTTIRQDDLIDGEIDINHNLNNENLIINIYDNDYNMIVPDAVRILDSNSINVALNSFEPVEGSYKIVILSDATEAITSVVGYNQIVLQADLQDGTIVLEHNLNNENIVVNVYNESKMIVIPDGINILNKNSIIVDLTSYEPLEGQYNVVILSDSTGNVGSNGAVLYTEAQTLTEEEKALARSNIGITEGGISDVFTFTSIDLVSSKLNISHTRNSLDVITVVYNASGLQVLPTEVQVLSTSEVMVDFTDITVPVGEEWKIVVQGGSAVIDGVVEAENAVLYTTQTLTDGQKSQAKTNLGIPTDLQNVADLIPTVTSDLTNDSGFLINTVDNLINYYDKDEVDVIIAAISQLLTYEVVTELPTTDIKTNVIYLKLVDGSTSNYSMNMYISGAWYELGETAIDLSQYVTLVEYNNRIAILEAALSLKANNTTIKASLDTDLTNNTEYIVNLSSDVTINSATGWGSINITALGNLTINIPAGHKWAEGTDGYIENGTQVVVLYDGNRWSRTDWR